VASRYIAYLGGFQLSVREGKTAYDEKYVHRTPLRTDDLKEGELYESRAVFAIVTVRWDKVRVNFFCVMADEDDRGK